MNLKNFFFITISLFLFNSALNAQIQISKDAKLKADTINKRIIDNTKYRIYYSLEFSKDSIYPQEKTKCQTILFIGSKYNNFQDYNLYREDSIYDALVKRNANQTEILAQLLPLGKSIQFEPIVLSNYPTKGNFNIQQSILSKSKYSYIDKDIRIEWKLATTEKTINGYKCQKATGKFRGRDYIAWYAVELPINSGPYLFSGLPGLILEIHDTKNHYNFKINGLVKVKGYDPIYLLTDNIIQSNRTQVRKAIYNSKNDPSSVIKSMGNVKISDDVLSKLKPKLYNPIELE